MRIFILQVVEREVHALHQILREMLEHVVTLQDPLLVISNGRIGLDRMNFAK